MLRIDYLSLPGLPALSFAIAARECLAVEGPSGCGKTRLLRAIADLDLDPARSLMVGDKASDMEAARRAGVRGVLFEGGDLDAFLAAALRG